MPIIKRLSQLFLQPVIRKRIHRTAIYTQYGFTLHIPPGVFHPAYFFSTQFLLKYIVSLPLEGKRFLELGAGNGLISFEAARKKAMVTASDVSKKVVETLKENAVSNNIPIDIILSDLFTDIPPQTFDLIAINPPYYPEDPRNDFELAWYSGKDFSYFKKLFAQLGNYLHTSSKVIMVLSEECDIEKIRSIAAEHGFQFRQVVKKRIYWEWNYIFEIVKTEGQYAY